LKKLECEGKLPEHITKISVPRYWKKNGKRELRIVVRKDCYSFDKRYLYLPDGIKVRYKGELKWRGEQGRLEIIYDETDKVWRGFMSVKLEEPPKQGGNKPLYIDLGVRCLAALWAEGWKQPIAFSGNQLLYDWWYWTKRIAREQSKLAKVNKAKTSKRLKKMYRIRQRRLRHAVNSMIKTIVEYASRSGISKIVLGDLGGVREDKHNSKVNAMINNFWSFDYTLKKFREKAEEHGIEVVEINEYNTSTICPKCRSDHTYKHKRLFTCLNCGFEAHRDAVGVINMGTLFRGMPIEVVAHPLLLLWDGMKWEPKRAMNNQPMSTLEARISRL